MSDTPGVREAAAAVRAHNDAFLAACGRAPRCYVLTFGCQQNEADSEKLAGMAEAMGYAVTQTAEDAALILVNTCAIRAHAEDKALSIIGSFKHLKERDPELVIGVCGCMVAQEHRRAQFKTSFPAVDFVLEPAALDRLPLVLAEILRTRRRVFDAEPSPDIAEHLPIRRGSAYRASVSIMVGCNNFCSYCIVPYVRGRERSRPPEAVVDEVRELVKRGYRDITLLGQNVNSYGRDRGGCDFADLLCALDAIPGDYLLRFMTSHPKDATEKLIDVMAAGKHIAHQFHLPLQSGSDRVLARMNRHYDRAHYLSILSTLREKVPDVTVTSDIIVGFPGESEEDFADTLDLLDRARFDMIYSFLFSPRKGTPAAGMDGQIPRAVQNERFERLLARQNEISLAANRALVGRTLRVLCDGASKTDLGVQAARSEGNKLVFFKGPARAGDWRTIRIDRAETFALYGTPADAPHDEGKGNEDGNF